MAERLLKVIHVNQRDDTATGGALRVAFELVKRLPEHDIDARLLFLYGGKGYFGSQLEGYSDYLHIGSSRNFWQLGKLRQYIDKIKPDIVHFHDDLLWPQLMLLGQRHFKTVIHAHGGGTPAPQPLKTRIMYACQRRYADAVVCITEEARYSQLRNVGFCPEQMHIVYNGVDTRHYRPPKDKEHAEAKRRFGFPSDKIVVGFVGRLHDAMKGCRDFIELVAALPENYMGLVVGSGPDEESLRAQADTRGVGHRIRFVGLLDDPLPAYHAMSVYCFMSRHEPFGLAIAEAMACGVPVVGFVCPGGSGGLLTNETSEVILQRDINCMAQAVPLAAQKSASWLTRIANASDLISRRHSWDKSAGLLAQLYISISNHQGGVN